MSGIKDKVAVITGGSQGLGKAMAREFATYGAGVVIASRNKETGDKALSEIREITEECCFIQTDVTDYSQVANLIKQAVRQFGQIDFMINNAAIFKGDTVTDITFEDWKSIFDTNVNGVLYCTQLAAKEMIARGRGGRIVNVSSIIGVTGKLKCSAYAASKGAINSFTKNAAIELAPYNILVNAIVPGVCDSEINLHISKKDRRRSESQIPLQRWARPEEIAKSTVFLCSELSTYITGHLLVVDGGYLAGKEISGTSSIL